MTKCVYLVGIIAQLAWALYSTIKKIWSSVVEQLIPDFLSLLLLH